MEEIKLKIPKFIKIILDKLQNKGFEAYVVGGCVRDALLGHIPNDWDVCTSAFPQDVKTALTGIKVIDTGIEHGTVTAVIDDEICEITTFRTDGDYIDHRHPQNVSFTRNIEEDLKRRDFTINAMAYSGKTGILDLYSGRADLKKELIRCVGDPSKRFDEDALRIVRALRFASCLSFEIESNTKLAMVKQAYLISYVAKERIFSEFKRMLCGDIADKIIAENKEVLKYIIPFDSIYKNSTRLKGCMSKNFAVRLALLLCDESVDDVKKSLKEMKMDNKTISSVSFFIENKDAEIINDKIVIKKLLSRYGRDKFINLLEFCSYVRTFPDYSLIKELALTLPVIELSTLKIDGNTLIERGITNGKVIKNLLNIALNAVIEEKCENEANEILKFVL